MITLRTQLVFLLLLPRISDQDVQSEDDFDFNLYNFLKIFQNLKIYLRSEPYLPVGKTIRTFVQGWGAQMQFGKDFDHWLTILGGGVQWSKFGVPPPPLSRLLHVSYVVCLAYFFLDKIYSHYSLLGFLLFLLHTA